MLEILNGFRSNLATLLQNESAWNSLNIDYEKPNVHRLWRQIGEYRLNLQRIFPCESE